MNTVTLQDPQSGRLVSVTTAQLSQNCIYCGQQLMGDLIARMEGGPGWVCLPHLERLLLSAEPSPALAAMARAREQLRDAQPGDVTTVTHTLLAALGVD